MVYSFELLPDEPILISTFHSEFSLAHDNRNYLIELASIISGAKQPVYHICDARELKVEVFQEFLSAINEATRERKVDDLPNLIKSIIVSGNDLMRLSMKGLDSEVFGNVSVLVVDTMEDAFANVRELIAQS